MSAAGEPGSAWQADPRRLYLEGLGAGEGRRGERTFTKVLDVLPDLIDSLTPPPDQDGLDAIEMLEIQVGAQIRSQLRERRIRECPILGEASG